MESPLISIIIPVYKVEPFLRKCLDSVVNQTYENLEIILVDDGSPDRCGEICDEYAGNDPRIRVIHQENGGLSAARNAGLDIVTGDYIGFVDSDDYIAPEMYGKLLESMLENSADMAVCNVFDERNGVLKPNGMPLTSSLTTTEIREGIISDIYYSYAWNKLFRRSLFDGVRFPEGRIYEDYWLMPVLCRRAGKITAVESYVYFYNRMNVNSLTYTDKIDLEREYEFFCAQIKRLEAARDYSDRTYRTCEDQVIGQAMNMLRYNACLSVLSDEKVFRIFSVLTEHERHIKKKMQWLCFKYCRPAFELYSRYRVKQMKKRREKITGMT